MLASLGAPDQAPAVPGNCSAQLPAAAPDLAPVSNERQRVKMAPAAGSVGGAACGLGCEEYALRTGIRPGVAIHVIKKGCMVARVPV